MKGEKVDAFAGEDDPFLNDPQLFEQSVQLAGEALYEDVLATSDQTVIDQIWHADGPMTGVEINGELRPNAFTLVDKNQIIVTIYFDPPSIEVNEAFDWNTAAKCFWNAVYRMAGKPALFPDD
jgi:hypothetical protein